MIIRREIKGFEGSFEGFIRNFREFWLGDAESGFGGSKLCGNVI
jgi:hypothetical protein